MIRRHSKMIVWVLILLEMVFIASCMPAGGQDAGAPTPAQTAVEATAVSSSEPMTVVEDTIAPSPGPATATVESIASGVLVLQNGSIFTATGGDPISDAAILIEDGVIMAVGPEAEIEVPPGAEVIDVEGRMMLPGLIDAHTHVLDQLPIEDGQISVGPRKVYLEMAMTAGLTTLRDVNSSLYSPEKIVEMRTALDTYGNTIPTIVLTGPSLMHPESPMAIFPGLGVGTVEEAKGAAQLLAESGVDQIKIFLHMRPEAGSIVGDPPEEIAPSLSLEQVQAIVDVAHGYGLLVTAHVIDPREAEIAIAAGVDELAHWPSTAEILPEDILQALVENNISVVSTFNLLPPQDGDVRRFLDAGGMLVFGTDAPGTGSVYNPYREFERMLRTAKMDPAEILLSATANAARSVGLGDLVGTLEVGKQADIIVVDGDPFADFTVMQKVVYVVKGGELVVKPSEDD